MKKNYLFLACMCLVVGIILQSCHWNVDVSETIKNVKSDTISNTSAISDLSSGHIIKEDLQAKGDKYVTADILKIDSDYYTIITVGTDLFMGKLHKYDKSEENLTYEGVFSKTNWGGGTTYSISKISFPSTKFYLFSEPGRPSGSIQFLLPAD